MVRRGRQQPRQRFRPRPRRRRRQVVQRPESALTSSIGWIPFKGTTYVAAVASTTSDFNFTISMAEIATAVGEELIGATFTDASLYRLSCRIHSLRVTTMSLKACLNVRFMYPRAFLESIPYLGSDTIGASYVDKECYPSPVRYPSCAFVYPTVDSRRAATGSGSNWFRVGQTDYLLASVQVQKPESAFRILITYDVRYRWSESPFHPTEGPQPATTSLAALKGWSKQLEALNEKEKKESVQLGSGNKYTASHRVPRDTASLGSLADLSMQE